MRYLINTILIVICLAAFSAAHNVAAQEYISDSWFPVQVDGKYGFIDRTGKIVIEPTFESVGIFAEGLADAKSGGKWGLIDRTGKLIWEPTK